MFVCTHVCVYMIHIPFMVYAVIYLYINMEFFLLLLDICHVCHFISFVRLFDGYYYIYVVIFMFVWCPLFVSTSAFVMMPQRPIGSL